jgi:hypothetical protein
MQCMIMMGPTYRISLIRLEEPIFAGDPVMIKRGMGGIIERWGRDACEAMRNQ